MRRPGQRLESRWCDRTPAAIARAEGARRDPREGGVHLGQLLDGSIAEREVALLLEDLARGSRLGSIGHRIGCHDRLADLAEQPPSLCFELCRERSRGSGIHSRTVRRWP
jgi:hypothetical protein